MNPKKRKARLARRYRTKRNSQLLPVLTEYCERRGILMRKVEHGWQFLFGEYVVSWHPGTNKIQVSYRLPGDGKTIPYVPAGGCGTKPKIFVALEALTSLAKT